MYLPVPLSKTFTARSARCPTSAGVKVPAGQLTLTSYSDESRPGVT
ncbi:Uncharacterised protein [Bordetella pertussis]|nr:Uncharacterised protein [Bordetella pertussis]CPN93656.1 Uncharacterised protein [Bordetella pertussis]